MNAEILKTKEIALFEKRTVAELSDLEMSQVDGGTTTVCVLASSEPCGLLLAAALVHIARSL